MPVTLDTFAYSGLQPVINPQDARKEAIQLGVSLTLAKGTLLGKRTSNGLHYAYNDALTDGTQTAVGILEFDVVTDADGNHYLGTNAVASQFNMPHRDASMFTCGTFDPTELTGWDAAAATDLKARTLSNGYYLIPG